MTPRKIRPLRCQRGGGGRHCGVQPAKTRPLTTNGPHRARRAATAQRNRISPSLPLASQSLPRGSEGPLREGKADERFPRSRSLEFLMLLRRKVRVKGLVSSLTKQIRFPRDSERTGGSFLLLPGNSSAFLESPPLERPGE